MSGVSGRLTALAFATGLSMLHVGATGNAAPIGEAAEARNDVTGELNSVARRISAGSDVSANEIVRTGEDSVALLRFLDDSRLTIGAVSTVVLDSFVYDPDRGTDDAVFSLTKGAMRFLSAGAGRSRNATIGTPVGIIGIRGTDVAIVCGVGPVCAALMASGRVRICPVPVGTATDQQQLRGACLRGDTGILPCGSYEIAAREEQRDGENNFTIIESDCVVSALRNLDADVFRWLSEQLASGGPLPDPLQLASFTPVNPGPSIGAAGIAAFLATVPFLVSGDDREPVSQ